MPAASNQRKDAVQDAIQVDVEDRVLKPIQETFDAVVDPAVLSGFFISGASGPLEQGKTITWTFADVGGKLDVTVTQLQRPHRIAFEWSASGTPAQVEMTFQAEGPDKTLARITEVGWPMDHDGVHRALGQTAGWTDFLCCMRAYLEHGVNLRLGRARTVTKAH